jgi:hypothetical protein
MALMRNITTLSLVFSNGYVLFSDPNQLPTPDHLHDWYPFWEKSLGKPTGPLATLDRPNLSGAYMREYERGEAVFNPPPPTAKWSSAFLNCDAVQQAA